MEASPGRGTMSGASVGAPGGAAGAPDAAEARRILALLQADDIDAAIEAGLAYFARLDALGADENDALAEARDRLLAAWAARERYRARAARLERITNERRSVRASRPPAPADASGTEAAAAPPAHGATAAGAAATEPASAAEAAAAPRPALPPAAAAALARARARATGHRS